ncbi:MAG: hypothetical protein ACR2MB_09665 [Acidimicrobiales bacterium]
MTLTLELPAELEARLRDEARTAGQTPAQWTLDLVMSELKPSAQNATSDFEIELDELLASQPDVRAADDLPPLRDDAVKLMYEERAATQL